MNFKYELVAHSKVHILHSTFIKKDRAKGNMIYLGTREIARIEMAINKSYRSKTTLGEITISKYARFKFLEIDPIFKISNIIVL
jgi:hypothetical protein